MQQLRKGERPGRFRLVTAEKAAGVTYTPPILADFVADQIVRAAKDAGVLRKKTLRVLDPAVGDGALLVSLLNRLQHQAGADILVFGFEPDARELEIAERRIRDAFPNVTCRLTEGDFLKFALDHGDFGGQELLFGNPESETFDLIIANPPYVRTQVMGAQHAQCLATRFGLAGRVDLYYAFVLAIGSVLDPCGVSGVIVSNRFMTTKAGGAVREAIGREVRLQHVWDLGDTKLFDAAVLPAVLLFEGKAAKVNAAPGFTSVYTTDLEGAATLEAENPIQALGATGLVGLRDGRRFLVRHGHLHGIGRHSIWRIATDEGNAWLATVAAKTWGTFREVGRIRVGVKTCADKVFIRDDWDEMPPDDRPELLRPLTTHHVGRRFRPDQDRKRRFILYPHITGETGRQAADLEQFPRAKAYLQKHRNALEARSYVLESGRKWYEIWVPQDPGQWSRPKLVFRDIVEKPMFWIDLEGSVVNGDCYWMTVEKGPEDLLWLAAAVGNSRFAEAFYDHRFHNKLYAKRRRFITQYVEQFPLPDPASAVSKGIIDQARRIYEVIGTPAEISLAEELEALVCEAFGLRVEEVGR